MLKRKTERKLDALMAEYFPHIGDKFSALRPEQREYISKILDGKDVMVVMPTAGGKSICFQLPALYWEDGITIVISPLRALIKEQVEELNKHGKTAAVIGGHSTIDLVYGDEVPDKQIFDEIIDKVYRLVYITPEMLTNNNFLRVLRRIREQVKMIAVDEAHCVSAWGYSFRPSYLDIRWFVETFSKRPVVSAYTATATKFIAQDTVRALGLKIEGPVEDLKYDRPDLTLHVKHIRKRKDDETPEEEKIREIKQHEVLNIVKKNVRDGNQGIIFCAAPGEVDSIYGYLVSKSEQLGCRISRYYSEGMSNEDRRDNLREFMEGRSLVMAATNAFGMGINMPGIKFVIHYNIPLCVENYCQETGRAARGKNVEADCYLLYASRDEKICRALISKNPYPERRRLDYERFEKMTALIKESGSREPSNELLHRRINDYFQDPGKENIGDIEDEARGCALYVNRTYIANEIRKGVFKAGYDQVKELHFRHTESYVRYKLYCGAFENDAELSYFDMMIADAVYSLWLNNRPVYAKSIWAVLSGDDQITLKKEKKEAIEKSLRKLQETSIRIEPHIMGNFGMKLRDESGLEVFDGPVMDFEERTKESAPYILKSAPPLYLYAEMQGQFHVFERKQLRLLQVEYKKDSSAPQVCADDSVLGTDEKGYSALRALTDKNGRLKKMQAAIENTILKHFLLRRMDLLPEAGLEKKIRHNADTVRKKGVVHAKKRSGVLSDRINYMQEDGTDLLEKLGVIHGTDYKYTLARQREEIVGTAEVQKNRNGSLRYTMKKRGRIEKILDYYVYIKMLSGYESRIHEDELRAGREMMYTQIRLDKYTEQEKQKYMIDQEKERRKEGRKENWE